MTGLRLVLMTDGQPDLPKVRPAEERAETVDLVPPWDSFRAGVQ
jgi:hypothetical protein